MHGGDELVAVDEVHLQRQDAKEQITVSRRRVRYGSGHGEIPPLDARVGRGTKARLRWPAPVKVYRVPPAHARKNQGGNGRLTRSSCWHTGEIANTFPCVGLH